MTDLPFAPVEFGRYRLLRLIGRGGMAEVYLAESQGPMTFRKLVAVKRLLPVYASNRRYVQMLLDEARIAAAINHPNVASVLDLGRVDDQHFITMEFVDGVDLADVLRACQVRGEQLPIELSLYIARCVAEGLHAAHLLTDGEGTPMQVVHRDVSPHNVLLSYSGDVKLIDFGVAKAKTNLTLTRSGIIKGKLQYMSPEQAQAQPVDARADIFSLGMTLYKMLTGRLPFGGHNEFQVYEQILRKRAAPPSHVVEGIPEIVDALVLRSLRKNPDERFPTALSMARLIDRALSELAPAMGGNDLARFLAESLQRENRIPMTLPPPVMGTRHGRRTTPKTRGSIASRGPTCPSPPLDPGCTLTATRRRPRCTGRARRPPRRRFRATHRRFRSPTTPILRVASRRRSSMMTPTQRKTSPTDRRR